MVHSPDLAHTLKTWSDHLAKGGVVAVIDDFLASSASEDDIGVGYDGGGK